MTESETQLEGLEPDRYVSLFFVPAAVRRDVSALYGFEMELARVASQVAEPIIAQIRYAWWREQLALVYDGRISPAPGFQSIAPVIEKHRLPRQLFDQLIDAHAVDCEAFPFADFAQMERYARETAACVFKLAARILGAGERVDRAADLAGVAYGLSRQLQEFAHWRLHKRMRLAFDAVPGADEEGDALSSDEKDRERFARAIDTTKELIRTHLRQLNQVSFPSRYVSILAPAAMARTASSDRFDVFEPHSISVFRRVARISAANLLLRF